MQLKIAGMKALGSLAAVFMITQTMFMITQSVGKTVKEYAVLSKAGSAEEAPLSRRPR